MDIHTSIDTDYADFLHDESRKSGTAESISFPRTEEEVRAALSAADQKSLSVTVQGARTGITGGAVPCGGHILNLSRMNRILGMRHDASNERFFLQVEPGVILDEIRVAVSRKEFDMTAWSEASRRAATAYGKASDYFFAPDPTEATAAIGGMVACNASGARSYRYGATRRHIEALHLVLADGTSLGLQRNMYRAKNRAFSIPLQSERMLECKLPSYEYPSVKCAAGYYVRNDMDPIDLFIGSEGTLGVITSVELALMPKPASVWGLVAFFPGEKEALIFVERLRISSRRSGMIPPAAIEYFDSGSLNLLRKHAEGGGTASEIPAIPPEYHTAIYVEYHGSNEDIVSDAVMAMSEIMVDVGGNEDWTWMATGEHEMEKLHLFRHAVPEAVNTLIDERKRTEPGLTKLGTDMAVSDDHLHGVFSMYHQALEASGLEYVIFGHVGNNHVHVNILPRTMGEYEEGKRIYLGWADQVIAMQGTVAAEHGIGKLKVPFLRHMYGESGIEEMRNVKAVFDPGYRLNPGNLFTPR